MTAGDLPDAQDTHPTARSWEEWRHSEQSPSEPHQEPVEFAPLPPYEYPTAPGEQHTPDGNTEHVPEVEREKTPVHPREREPRTHFPPRTRTRPFLPARRGPEIRDEPAPFIQDEPPPALRKPAPVQKSGMRFLEPEKQPENFGSEFSPEISSENFPENAPNFSQPESELTPGPPSEFSGQPKPATALQPKFTTKWYDKQPEPKKRGRQRAKDRNSAADGVRQLFELWWHKGGRGVTFQQFYRTHLSDDMRSYYAREYINGRNPKSAAEYRQWRKEWAARTSVKTA